MAPPTPNNLPCEHGEWAACEKCRALRDQFAMAALANPAKDCDGPDKNWQGMGMAQLRLNLGAANRHIPGYISVDIAGECDQRADLSAPWPWDDSSVDEVLAFDVVEHIGDCQHQTTVCSTCANRGGEVFEMVLRSAATRRHPLGRIHFLNELWRVLKPGARATIETPNAARGVGFIQDCTHVSPWCLSSFKYFEDGAFARQRLGDLYGITARFKVISLDEFETSGEDPRERVWKIKATLGALKLAADIR